MTRRIPRRLRTNPVRVELIIAFSFCLLAAGCGGASSSGNSSGSVVNNATVTVAEQPGANPNYIFPVTPAADCTVANYMDLFYLMYRPVYWWGSGSQAGVNYNLSLATAPDYSNGGKTVTLHLKPYKWSDGMPVTASDIVFWMNLVKANKSDFCNYIPGELPDNVSSYEAVNPSTFQITFTKVYSQQWMLGNELSLLIPLPKQVWDRTSAAGPIGNFDATTSGAKKVFSFLNDQAEQMGTFASNPLWRVVDGPFKLQAFTTTGQATFVPNPSYSGPRTGHIGKLVELPFTSEAAEYNALRAGDVDYGYLPFTDAAQSATLKGFGYAVDPWYTWAISYEWFNFSNPTAGPIFDQLYVRQAFQEMINEPQLIKDVFYGYATPTNGPVPTTPLTSLASPLERSTYYPYDPAKARDLLTSHGWSKNAQGTLQCASPGTGQGQCGAGISRGAQMNFTLLTSSGVQELTSEAEVLKSVAGGVGVTITIQQQPANTVFSLAVPCNHSTGAGCKWDIINAGTPTLFFIPPTYPTGDFDFHSGAPLNAGAYTNATNDADILSTDLESGTGPMYTWEDFLVQQLPVIWLPNNAYQISLIKNTVHGAGAQSAYAAITPEDWYVTK
jgi:peptide/nickel transport system substrate-binding protein